MASPLKLSDRIDDWMWKHIGRRIDAFEMIIWAFLLLNVAAVIAAAIVMR